MVKLPIPENLVGPRRTRPVQRASRNEFAIDTSGLARGLSSIGAALAARQQENEQFAVSNALIEHRRQGLLDFDKAKDSASIDDTDFLQRQIEADAARKQSTLEKLKTQGVSGDTLNRTEARLNQESVNSLPRVIEFDSRLQAGRLKQGVEQLVVVAEQTVTNSPDLVDSTIASVREAIDALPNADARVRQALAIDAEERINKAAARALPPEVVDKAFRQKRQTGVGESYFAAVRQAESGGSLTAKNPRSSALGPYQFTKGTWDDLRRRHPDAGLTEDGRTDAQQNEVAIRLFTRDNQRALQESGITPTAPTLYAAHFLGVGDAIKVLNAPNGASLTSLLSESVIKANPFLRRMDVTDFAKWAQSKVGKATGPQFGATGHPIIDRLSPDDQRTLLRQKQSELDAIEAVREKADDQKREDTEIEIFDRMFEGDLTIDDLDAFRDDLDPRTFRRVRDSLQKDEAKETDRETFLQLHDLAQTDPDQALIAARDEFRAGTISKGTFGNIRSSVERARKIMEERPAVREIRAFLKQSLKPKRDSRTAQENQWLGLFAFDDFVDDNLTATREELFEQAKVIRDQFRRARVQVQQGELPLPRFGRVGRDEMTQDAVTAAAKKTTEEWQAGRITRAEAAEQAKLLQQWQDTLSEKEEVK